MIARRRPAIGHREEPVELGQQVERKELRKIKARRERGRGVWFGLGMFGVVGWSITIPTLVGVVLGAWIDRTWPSQYSWTLMSLFAGLAIGCWLAWHWVASESQEK